MDCKSAYLNTGRIIVDVYTIFLSYQIPSQMQRVVARISIKRLPRPNLYQQEHFKGPKSATKIYFNP